MSQTLNQLHLEIGQKSQQKSMMNMMYMPPNQGQYYSYPSVQGNPMGGMMGPHNYMHPPPTMALPKNIP